MLLSGTYNCSGLWRGLTPLACIAATVRVGVFIGILAMPSRSHAGPVSLQDASLVTQSVANDVDYFSLNQIEGLTAQTTYNSTPGGAGWTGSLTGGGANIAYTGDTSQYNTTNYGSITWSSVGSFNSDTWNATGIATFTPTAAGAQFTISDHVTVAGADETGCITISGYINYNNGNLNICDLSTSGHGFFRGGKITVKWPEGFDYSLHFFVNDEDEEAFVSHLTVPGFGTVPYLADSGTVNPFGTTTVVVEDVASRGLGGETPEPSSVVLFGLGIAGLILYRRRSRGRTV